MTINFIKLNSAGILTLLSVFGSVILACTKKDTGINPTVNVVTPTPSDTSLIRYLALGDSYTIGQSVAEAERFPVQVVDLLSTAGYKMAKAEIIATTGWTTANLYEAIQTCQLADWSEQPVPGTLSRCLPT
jgi:hypothetical protein